MRAVVAVLLVAGFALAEKDETARKTRQVYTALVHPQVYDYSHPSLVAAPAHYLQPTVQGFGIVPSHAPQLSSVIGPEFPFHNPVPTHHTVGYLPSPYYGQQYNPSYTPSQVHLPPRTRIPDTHPVREENNDFELPTSTPLYGFRQTYRTSTHYGNLTPSPLINPYHPTNRNLASVAPYTFPPTRPTLQSYEGSSYGTRTPYVPNSRLSGSTPAPTVRTQLSSRVSLSNQLISQSESRPGNQQPLNRVDQAASILSQSGEIRNDGSYNFGFESGNGIQSSESGRMRPVGDSMSPMVQGRYSYTAPDGTPVEARYFADETGFHVQGSHVPSSSLGAPAGSGQQQSSAQRDPQQRPASAVRRS